MDRKRAVLLLNMGGANSVDEVELFLRNMFADPKILPMQKPLRDFVSNIIIAKRLEEARENYRLMGGKSPLPAISTSLAEKVSQHLGGMPVYPTMRYVPPFTDTVLRRCQEQGIEEILCFPMYPHYSTTTTESSVDELYVQCERLGYRPKISVVDPYYDDASYVALTVDKIREALGNKAPEEYDLILSAHGLPMSIIKAGDPYEKHVEANVSAIKMELHHRGIAFRRVLLAYQSKVGNAAWLEPNLADILRNPKHRKVLIYPLAFTVDNSETVFELDVEHREIAEKLRFEEYLVAKCPNDDEPFASFIAQKIEALQSTH